MPVTFTTHQALAQTAAQIDGAITETQKYQAMTPAERKAKWQNLSDSKKAEIKTNAKAKWDAMTPAQKSKIEANAKGKWDTLTPEQKQLVIDRTKTMSKKTN